jgi:hypothetical protein
MATAVVQERKRAQDRCGSSESRDREGEGEGRARARGNGEDREYGGKRPANTHPFFLWSFGSAGAAIVPLRSSFSACGDRIQ